MTEPDLGLVEPIQMKQLRQWVAGAAYVDHDTFSFGRGFGAAMVDAFDRYLDVVSEVRAVWPLLRGCEHDFDPECARCKWLLPLSEALHTVDNTDGVQVDG